MKRLDLLSQPPLPPGQRTTGDIGSVVHGEAPRHRSLGPISLLEASAGRWGRVLLPLLTVVAGVLAYLPVFHAGFVFDDHSLVENSALLRGALSQIWFSTAPKDYWPLTYTALWIQWRLWGSDPTGYHVVNLALHLGTALLLGAVLRALRVPGAWIAALLFAVHPVTVESAAWISEHKNTLSAALFLAAVWAWLRFQEGGRRLHHAAALVAFAAALLAKTSVVMGPFVLLALHLRAKRRLTARGAFSLAPFFALSLVAGLATLWFQGHQAMAGAPPLETGVLQRAASAGWALFVYVQTALVPCCLSFVYPDWPIRPSSPAFYLPAIVVVVAAALLWRSRAGRSRPLGIALGYHALMLLPVLGLVEMAYLAVGPVSNHLQYLALMGPVALVAFALARLGDRAPAAAVVVTSALVVVLGATTFDRARAFHDDLTLWQEAVRTAPRSGTAHFQLASLLADAGRERDAVHEYQLAEVNTRSPDQRLRARAWGALHAGDRVEASRAASLLETSRDADLRRDAALVLAGTGARNQAIAILRQLVATLPASPDYMYWLGALLSQSGRVEEASDVLRAWCTRRPGNPRMEQAFAFTLVRLGRFAEARHRAALVADRDENHPETTAQLERWMSQPGWRGGG